MRAPNDEPHSPPPPSEARQHGSQSGACILSDPPPPPTPDALIVWKHRHHNTHIMRAAHEKSPRRKHSSTEEHRKLKGETFLFGVLVFYLIFNLFSCVNVSKPVEMLTRSCVVLFLLPVYCSIFSSIHSISPAAGTCSQQVLNAVSQKPPFTSQQHALKGPDYTQPFLLC